MKINIVIVAVIILIALKITATVNISWWIVLLPAWLPIVTNAVGLLSIWIVRRWR